MLRGTFLWEVTHVAWTACISMAAIYFNWIAKNQHFVLLIQWSPCDSSKRIFIIDIWDDKVVLPALFSVLEFSYHISHKSWYPSCTHFWFFFLKKTWIICQHFSETSFNTLIQKSKGVPNVSQYVSLLSMGIAEICIIVA